MTERGEGWIMTRVTLVLDDGKEMVMYHWLHQMWQPSQEGNMGGDPRASPWRWKVQPWP